MHLIRKEIFILVCTLLMVSGCGLFQKKPPQPLEPTRIVLELEAAGDINPNISGRPSPLEVRIYQLRSYSLFEDADFNALFEKDEEVLGRDLVAKKKIYLKPNEKRTVFFETPDDINAVGILAAFRYYDHGRWKTAASVQENKTNVINVFIKGTSVQLK